MATIAVPIGPVELLSPTVLMVAATAVLAAVIAGAAKSTPRHAIRVLGASPRPTTGQWSMHDLTQLASLHQQRALSNEEFAAAKAKLFR